VKTWREEARDLPVAGDVDVLVAGAGPAGFAAAVCAARMGARTMLVEQAGAVGGMATVGLMSHWTGATRGGFYDELLGKSADLGGEFEGGDARQIIDPEKLKTVMLEMLEEAGAGVRLYSFVAGPVMDGRKVAGIITESKSGREVFLAQVVIDATGDGDVASRAGVPFKQGRANDGSMQPATIMFKVGGVDTSKAVFPGGFEDTFQVPEGDLQTLGRKHLPHPAGHVLLYRSSLPGVVTCNMTNCTGVDGTKTEDLTRAERICRGQMEAIVGFLRKYVPGFGKCYLLSSASLIGIRETRHFEGEYTLTDKDILEAKVFDDWAVTKAHFNFDVHSLTGAGLDETGLQKYFPQERGYTIPYRCLVPRNIEGLLLAGRNISGTHLAHSSFRVMPICANMGQAAGIAAALSVRLGVAPRALPVVELQKALRKQGVEP